MSGAGRCWTRGVVLSVSVRESAVQHSQSVQSSCDRCCIRRAVSGSEGAVDIEETSSSCEVTRGQQERDGLHGAGPQNAQVELLQNAARRVRLFDRVRQNAEGHVPGRVAVLELRLSIMYLKLLDTFTSLAISFDLN